MDHTVLQQLTSCWFIPSYRDCSLNQMSLFFLLSPNHFVLVTITTEISDDAPMGHISGLHRLGALSALLTLHMQRKQSSEICRCAFPKCGITHNSHCGVTEVALDSRQIFRWRPDWMQFLPFEPVGEMTWTLMVVLMNIDDAYTEDLVFVFPWSPDCAWQRTSIYYNIRLGLQSTFCPLSCLFAWLFVRS